MKGTGRNRGAAILLFVALVAATLATIIVPGVLRWKAHGDIIRESREKVARADDVKNSFVRLARAGNLWTDFSQQARTGFLIATSPEHAQEVAHAYVSGLVTEYGGTIKTLTTEAGESNRERVETVIVTLDAVLPKERLTPMLTVLENKPPYTMIDTFSVSASRDDTVALRFTAKMQRFLESQT